MREYPSIATNAGNRTPQRLNATKSTCTCRPGSVSKRTNGSSLFAGRRSATYAFSCVRLRA